MDASCLVIDWMGVASPKGKSAFGKCENRGNNRRAVLPYTTRHYEEPRHAGETLTYAFINRDLPTDTGNDT
jgi:hypothetical protein